MYTVSKTIRIEMAHRLLRHGGLCHFIHGHSWEITATVEGAELNERTGMLTDFSRLKDGLKTIFGILDHALLLNEDDPLCTFLVEEGSIIRRLQLTDGEPTCERLAAWGVQQLREWRYEVTKVTIRETRDSVASALMGERRVNIWSAEDGAV